MKRRILTLDLTPVAFVAAMVVLLSTMVFVSTASAMSLYYPDDLLKNTDEAEESYALADVKSVTSVYVDPNEMMADEEYTKYIITLKSGKVFYVKQHFAPVEVFHEAIRDTGYTGDIEDLLDMTEEADEDVKDEVASLEEHIKALQTKLRALLDKAGDDDKKVLTDKPKNTNNKPTALRWCEVDWSRPLRVGDRGQDVLALQQFLNAKGILVAESGEGAPGFETDYFGPRTAEAVARWQEKYKDEVLSPAGLTVGSGYFGNLSQKLLQRHCGGEVPDDSDDDSLLRVSAVGKVATARFDLGNGCMGYEIDWGDGEVEELEGSDGDVCTMIFRMMALTHTYEEAGTYDIELTVYGSGEEETDTAEVTIREGGTVIGDKRCTSGNLTFAPGTRTSGYTDVAGAYKSATTGIYVCLDDGTWTEKEFSWEALRDRLSQ